MKDSSTCYGCGFEATGLVAACPRCGNRVLSSRQIRLRGWLLVVVGSLLMLMMGAIIVWASRVAFGLGSRPTDRFTGGTDIVVLIFTILYLVLAFGVLTVIAGVGQIRHGRPDWRILRIIIWLVSALYLIGVTITIWG